MLFQTQRSIITVFLACSFIFSGPAQAGWLSKKKDVVIPIALNGEGLFGGSVFARVSTNGDIFFEICSPDAPCQQIMDQPMKIEDVEAMFPESTFEANKVDKAGFKEFFKGAGVGHLVGTALVFTAVFAESMVSKAGIKHSLAEARFLTAFYLAGPLAALVLPAGYAVVAIVQVATILGLVVAISSGLAYWGVKRFNGRHVDYEAIEVDLSVEEFVNSVREFEATVDQIPLS